MAFKQLQAQNFSLAGAGCVIGDTTLILKTFTQIDGTTIAMSDLGAIGYLTLEPGNSTLEEQVSFTGVTQNANGTATLSGIKSVTFDSPYTETSGFSKTHAGSTVAVLSNTSGYYSQFGIKQNDETVLGQWSVPTPLSNGAIANKLYVDTVAGSGTVTTNALTVAGTAGENVTAGQIVYFKVSDGLWYKTDADSASTTDLIQLGVAQSTATTGNPIVSGVMLRGITALQSGLVAGTLYYLSNTAGAISSSTGTIERVIGQGVTTTTLLFDPNFYYTPTGNQKAAFVGTSGTPSASNKFVTAAGLASTVRFGGTGSDGALAITSGTTTIDLAGAVTLVKNYTSISITGTGALAFSNPHANGSFIILKSQGDVTLTSSAAPMIDGRSLGATGGAGFSGANGTGTSGTDAISNVATCKAGTAGTPGTGGVGYNPLASIQGMVYGKQVPLFAGAGGAGGSTSTGSVGGNGGRGAGGLYIEVGGALNFTTSGGISVAGGTGANGSGGVNTGGGGGGAGGSCVVLYNTLTAASGTITTTAGAGGTGLGSGVGGGGGANVASGAAGAGAGGAGAAGFSLIAANTEFV